MSGLRTIFSGPTKAAVTKLLASVAFQLPTAILLLAIVPLLGLAACGSDSKPTNSNDNTDSTQDNTPLNLQVDGIVPDVGSAGDEIEVQGDGFDETLQVYFGDIASPRVILASPKSARVEVPEEPNLGFEDLAVDVTVELADGQSKTLTAAFSYKALDAPQVEWAKLQYPPSLTVLTEESFEAYGRVFVDGITNQSGQGAGIEGQFGYGTSFAQLASWTWVAAAYNTDVDEEANDEYRIEASVDSPGQYVYAFRFRRDGGPWLYADLDGSDNGFEAEQLGALMVEAPPEPQIDWAVLRGNWLSNVATNTNVIFGVEVYEPGVSEGAGAGQNITVEIGYGDYTLDPRQNASSWTFVSASYVEDRDGSGTLANDYFEATFQIATLGLYGVLARVRLQDGPWRYVDMRDRFAEFDPAYGALLSVAPEHVDWCIYQYPATLNATAGQASALVYSQVYEGGVTGSSGNGQMRAQLVAAGAEAAPASLFTNTALSFEADRNVGFVDANNSEYQASAEITSAGTYSSLYRYSLDDGASWTYCDRDVSTNGIAQDQLGEIVVSE